jgi:hypothetical protein
MIYRNQFYRNRTFILQKLALSCQECQIIGNTSAYESKIVNWFVGSDQSSEPLTDWNVRSEGELLSVFFDGF